MGCRVGGHSAGVNGWAQEPLFRFDKPFVRVSKHQPTSLSDAKTNFNVTGVFYCGRGNSPGRSDHPVQEEMARNAQRSWSISLQPTEAPANPNLSLLDSVRRAALD